MGCNCGKRTMLSQTSINQPPSELDRPDIVAARAEEARQRVEAQRSPETTPASKPGSNTSTHPTSVSDIVEN